MTQLLLAAFCQVDGEELGARAEQPSLRSLCKAGAEEGKVSEESHTIKKQAKHTVLGR